MQTGLRTQTAETRDLDRAGNNGCVRSTEKRRKLQDEEKVVRSQKELCDLEKQLFDCKKAIVESRQWKGGNLMRGSVLGLVVLTIIVFLLLRWIIVI